MHTYTYNRTDGFCSVVYYTHTHARTHTHTHTHTTCIVDYTLCTHIYRAHEAWGLDNPPEFVTFSKKMQLGGYYYSEGCRPRQTHRIFNTWMGDPSRLMLADVILNEINNKDLIKSTREAGETLLTGLKSLQVLSIRCFKPLL